MNKFLIIIGFIVSGVVGWYLGQRQVPLLVVNDDASILATVNNETISTEAFIKKMKFHGGLKAGQYHSLEQKESLLNFLVNQEVIFSLAKEKGITEDFAVMDLYKKKVVDRYLELELAPLLARTKVSSLEVQQYFNKNKQSYARPARRRGAIIFVETHEKDSAQNKQKKGEKIKKAYAGIQELDENTLHFGELAKTYSEDRNSRYQGGVIGWLINHPSRKYKWHDKVIDTLFSLKEKGDYSEILETDQGFYIVRLVALENSQEKALSKVEKGIKNSLLQAKKKQVKEQFLAELISNAEITINKNLLASIQPLSEPASKKLKQPPALPGTGGDL